MYARIYFFASTAREFQLNNLRSSISYSFPSSFGVSELISCKGTSNRKSQEKLTFSYGTKQLLLRFSRISIWSGYTKLKAYYELEEYIKNSQRKFHTDIHDLITKNVKYRQPKNFRHQKQNDFEVWYLILQVLSGPWRIHSKSINRYINEFLINS